MRFCFVVVSKDLTNLLSQNSLEDLQNKGKFIPIPEAIKFHLVTFVSDISVTYFDDVAQCTFSFFSSNKRKKQICINILALSPIIYFLCFDVFTSCVHNCIFTRVYT